MKKFLLTICAALVAAGAFADKYRDMYLFPSEQGAKTAATLNTVISNIGTRERTLCFRKEWTIDTDVTVPSNIVLKVENGGSFNISTNVTMTFDTCLIEAGSYKIFDGWGNLSGILRNPAKELGWVGYYSVDGEEYLHNLEQLRSVDVGSSVGGMFMAEQIEIQDSGGGLRAKDNEGYVIVTGGDSWSINSGATTKWYGEDYSIPSRRGAIELNAATNIEAHILFKKGNDFLGWCGLNENYGVGYDVYRWAFVGPVNIDGDTYLDNVTVSSNLTVSGSVSVADLEVTGDTTLGGTLTLGSSASNSVFSATTDHPDFATEVNNVVDVSGTITSEVVNAGSLINTNNNADMMQSYGFSAYKTATQSHPGSDAYVKVTWEAEHFDAGSNFDLSLERFVAPVAGMYIFTTGVRLEDVAQGDSLRMALYTNGVRSVYSRAISDTATDDPVDCITQVFRLEAGDYVESFCSQSYAGAWDIEIDPAHFSGAYLGGY